MEYLNSFFTYLPAVLFGTYYYGTFEYVPLGPLCLTHMEAASCASVYFSCIDIWVKSNTDVGNLHLGLPILQP